MGGAFCTALGLAAAILAAVGTDARGIDAALQMTARFSFVPFWFAYAGGALRKVFGPNFQVVARRGREFGLAFASAQSVHIGLVVWLYRISARSPVSDKTLVIFGIATILMYLLALFSIRPLSQALGPTRWKVLRTVGLEYIALAFFLDFVGPPIQATAKSLLGYLPFSILVVAGAVLRLIAWTRARPPRVTPGAWRRSRSRASLSRS